MRNGRGGGGDRANENKKEGSVKDKDQPDAHHGVDRHLKLSGTPTGVILFNDSTIGREAGWVRRFYPRVW